MNQDFFSTLTLDEVETIENLSGQAMDELMGVGKLKGKALKAIIWVAKKRVDPDFKMEDAGKVTFAEALELFQGAGADPKA
jgi:hypothetical protein